MAQQTDVEVLFKNSNIDEIKVAEKNLRGEIEKKKEDLRLMVGERYRDLINAADTISQMRELTKEVHSGVDTIQKCCRDFKKKTRRRRHTTNEDIKLGSEEIDFYALATQMELLVDTPEKIWDALDKQKYLTAAQLYLLGHHIVNNSLHMNSGYGSDVFASFPILHHQWAAISHFKESILKERYQQKHRRDIKLEVLTSDDEAKVVTCSAKEETLQVLEEMAEFGEDRESTRVIAAVVQLCCSIGSAAALRDQTLPDKALAESLCSTILLNDSSPRQVFMEFLLARKAAIQDLFHPSQHKTSIKRQICDVTSLLVLTLQQIYSLFHYAGSHSAIEKQDGTSLLYKTIHDVTQKKQTDQGESLQWLFGEDFDVLTVARHLPPIVSGFRPKLRNVVNVVPLPTIQNGAKEWIAGCIRDVHDGVDNLLKYIKSVKGLALIRDAVYDLLANSRLFDPKNELDTSVEDSFQEAKDWNHLCETVLNRRLSIWNEFFEDLFVKRAKSILEKMFAETFTTISQSINEAITNLEDSGDQTDSEIMWDRDVTSYLWQELPGDLPTSGWCMEANPGETVEASSLTLKAKGCTPAVRRLCKCLDAKLGEIVQDGKYLLQDVEISGQQVVTKQEGHGFSFEEDTRIEPFQKFASATETQTFLQQSTKSLSSKICHHIDQFLDSIKLQLSNTTEDGTSQSLSLDRVTFLGRMCTAFPDYCMNLKCLACSSQEEAKSLLVQKNSKYLQRKSRQPKQKESSTNFDEIKSLFHEKHISAFRIWKQWVVGKCALLFEKTLLSVDELIVYGTTCWEDVSIEEEGDTGTKVQSKIRVPAQVSSFFLSLLFRLCEETNRIGGHVLDRSLVKQLTLEVGGAIFTSLEKFIKSDRGLSQNQALQFIFDVKFLNMLIGGNTETKDEACNKFKSRGKSLTSKLESFVDPFDLDVFTPHMTNFIHRQLQRSWLLLGTISNIDKHSLPLLTHRSTSMSQEQHNVIPLAPNPVRFMLLPISSQQDKVSQMRIEDLEFDQNKDANQKMSIKCPLFEHLAQFTLDF